MNFIMNMQSIVALLFVLGIVWRSRPHLTPLSRDGESFSRQDVLLVAAIAAVAGLAFLRTADAPFLHDSYSHVVAAAARSWKETFRIFRVQPAAGDFFYRPIGYLSYYIDSKWAGFVPVRWHIWNMALHGLNSGLVYYLARLLALRRAPSLAASLVFALHGSRPEVVSWVAARFDLLAAFFVLLTLVSVCRVAATGAGKWYLALAFFAVLGLLSKESAYCVPFLALGVAPFQSRPVERKRTLRASLSLLAICTIVFAYRLWLLGNIGGYRTAAGQPTILHFSSLLTSKALLYRDWGLIFFPLNWSAAPNALVGAALVLTLLLMLFAIWTSRPDRCRLLTALGWIVAAALPVQHLLLIGADMNGSRVLYLPVLGLALFWAVVIEAFESVSVQKMFVMAVSLSQFVLLDHNLHIWRQAASLSQRTCIELGGRIASDQRPVVVRNLPMKWNGVFFLRNGFPQCVALNSGVNVQRIHVDDGPQVMPDGRVFVWNSSSAKLEEETPQ